MKKTNYYHTPDFEVVELEVEQGYSLSDYGDYGEPGQDSGYNDYDGDL